MLSDLKYERPLAPDKSESVSGPTYPNTWPPLTPSTSG